jgi:hypothetical protein
VNLAREQRPPAGAGVVIALWRRGRCDVAQRHVETLIGRLLTDERLRAAFLAEPERTLREQADRGLDLSPTEIAALLATSRELWSQAASLLDGRLQKASLEPTPRAQERTHHV